MNQSKLHTKIMKTIFNRYYHYLLTGISLLFVLASLPMTGCDVSNSNDEKEPSEQIEELRSAVEPFRDFNEAQAAGYTLSVPDNPEECMKHPPLGAMGFHYANPDLIPNEELLVTQPEVLIYEPQEDGTVEFVGVEYVIPFSVLGEEESPPILFGEEFRQSERFQVWALHVWVGKDNPSGIFPNWNPSVSCEHADKWINR